MVQSSQEGGMVSLKKTGLRRLLRYPSLISILELAICLVGKTHMANMKQKLNFFSLGFSAYKLLFFQEARDLYKFNYTCSAELSLHAAERGQ